MPGRYVLSEIRNKFDEIELLNDIFITFMNTCTCASQSFSNKFRKFPDIFGPEHHQEGIWITFCDNFDTFNIPLLDHERVVLYFLVEV